MIFYRDGGEEYESGLWMQPFDLAEKHLVLRPKLRQPCRPGERLIHPVAEHDHLGRPSRKEHLQVLHIAFGARPPSDLVTRPSEAAHPEVFVGMGELQIGFQLAGFEETLDHGVAIEEEGVVLGQGNLGRDERSRGEECEDKGENWSRVRFQRRFTLWLP